MGIQEKEALIFCGHIGILRPGLVLTFNELTERAEDLFQMLISKGAATHIDLTAIGGLMHAVATHKNSGGAIFRFSPLLMKLLKETDPPKDISTEFVKIPFEGILIEFAKGTFKPPAENVTHLYISHAPGDRFRVIFPDDLSRTVHFASFVTTGEESIADAVEKARNNLIGLPLKKELREEFEANKMYEDYFESDVFTFAVNAALYLTSQDADVERDTRDTKAIQAKLQGVKQGVKRDILEKNLQRAKDHKIYLCGYRLTPETEEHTESRHLTKRFRVRGHFRHQVCGTGRLDRKTIWISPFWKGPTFAETLARNYQVS